MFQKFSIIIFSFLVLALLCFAGCDRGDDDDDNDDKEFDEGDDDAGGHTPVTQAFLSIEEGNFQSGYVGETLAKPFVVKAVDEKGKPASGLGVIIQRLRGEGEGKASATFEYEIAGTFDGGLAVFYVHLGDTPGQLRVQVGLEGGVARPVIFHASIYPKPTETKKPICFLSINDFHTHPAPWGHPDDPQGGLARLAFLFKTIRENNDAVGIETIIIDAGDDFENTLYNDVPGFLEWLIASWDRMGVDLWQVGNHDFHFGIPFLTGKVLAASESFSDGVKGRPMQVTFGNVDPGAIREDLVEYADYFERNFTDDAGEKLFQQSTILNAGPIRVGILGAVTDAGVYTQVPGDPAFLRLMGASNPSKENMTFFDPDPRKSGYIAKGIDSLIAEGADIVVVASHAGLGLGDRVNLPVGKDYLIAAYGQGLVTGHPVDLIISAHSHAQLNRPIMVRNPAGGITPIVQAKEGGLFAARVDAVVDIDRGGMDLIDSRLIQINSDLREDAEVASEFAEWQVAANQQYGDWFAWELVESDVWLSHRAQTISGLGMLINDSFEWKLDQEAMPVDASVAVPSLYRADIWPGTTTGDAAYDVLPLHKMDEVGHNPDSICILTFRPGILNTSVLGVPGTWHWNTTAVEYVMEIVHVLPGMAQLVPAFSHQLKIDVVQMSGVSYDVDVTAPMFSRVISGSVSVDGEAIDPERTYRIAMVHSLATTLAATMNTLILATDEDGEVVSVLIDDPDTGESFTDTEIPIWQAFQEYLDALPGGVIEAEDVTVDGRNMRTVQPDLAVNSTEISVSNAIRGETATISLRVRNNGLQLVKRATVRAFIDMTPWDLTDQDDGRSEYEGLSDGYLGSLKEIGHKQIHIGPHPHYLDMEFPWNVPADLPRGLYTAHIRIEDIRVDRLDPNTSAPYTDPFMDNNGGEQVKAFFEVR
jgi:2',3'-cyclic-nucleotide 2'-phosphodiesterase (5'-nucleotidase family)